MNKQNFSLWSKLIVAIAMLAVPMLAAAAPAVPPQPVVPYSSPAVAALYPSGLGFNPVVNYKKPNFAQSPNIRKFVDSLPGLGAANTNNLGQYIPVAIPDTATFPGDGTAANPASDFYEISIGQYNQQMHSDLPASGTTLRGYAQISSNNSIVDPTVIGVQQYLGPLIIAKTYDPTKPAGVGTNGKPVRLKVYNNLPTANGGAHPLPVDTTIMGAGMGPSSPTELYTQNRATIHLHGGATPWISDGTPHQWFTPAGATSAAGTANPLPQGGEFPERTRHDTGTAFTACRAGVFCFTPAVPPANDGIATYYYSNEQSARLMFYHDHAYGITRLNVYDGMAAPYMLYDQYEQDMIDGTNFAGANPTQCKAPARSGRVGSQLQIRHPPGHPGQVLRERRQYPLGRGEDGFYRGTGRLPAERLCAHRRYPDERPALGILYASL